jgi:TrmH family RNA methyltransferase
MPLLPIRMVLVDTSHPGNIGAAARAMKNMALCELVLVRPRQFPSDEATARASGAADVLEGARVCATTAEALAGCALVLACTARERDHYYRVLDVREAAERVVTTAAQAPVGIVFGPEQSGLANDELARVHALLRIPTGTHYASLNVAMAVQIVSYEILRARGATVAQPPREVPLAPMQNLELMYAHLASVLEEIDFRDRTQNGSNLMNRIRRFVQRAELDGNEVNIVRGILTAVQQRRRRAGA